MTSGALNNTTGQASPQPQNLPPSTTPASPPSKRDLRSWWKNFKLPSKQPESQHDHRGPGIFGVPLRTSITYANVAISLVDENGQSYIYGYVPIVVAKCGVFLKEKATNIEGIFRLSGSEKRIKELKIIFDSPDRYGKGLSWDGYTVHDAANVLRRYLNDLPEPVVPLDLYERFRDPLRGATKQAVGDSEGPQFVDSFNETAAIECYQTLITELPPLNKQLLLYILDLLAVFAAKSDENRMTSQNLAAIFQPGMLSHPTHAMAPDEYRLNQCVIIFLIENQDHFLIGMQGTAADENTMKEVASGSPNGTTASPSRKIGLGRTASSSSAGAESVRRDGQVRRNRSVSSRHSRVDGAVTPKSPALTATPTGGLGRSNTLPSKRSPALIGAKFRYDSPGPAPKSPALESLNHSHLDEVSSNDAGWSSQGRSSHSRSQDRLLDVPQDATTSTKDRSSQNAHHLFQRSPLESNDKRQPNKLRKRRIPGSINISAQSSCTSLPPHNSGNASPTIEGPDPLESPPQVPMLQARPTSQSYPNHASHIWKRHSPSQSLSQQAAQPVEGERPAETFTPPSRATHDGPLDSNHRASHSLSHNSLHPEDGARGRRSPPQSIHSSFNDGSDVDQVVDETLASTAAEHSEKEKRHRWRLSRSKKEDFTGPSGSPLMAPSMNIGSNHNAEISTTSIGSALHKPSKSITRDSSEHSPCGGDRAPGCESGRDDTKGPFSWIKTKYREAKGNADHKRCKSPPPSETHHPFSPEPMAPRGKSLDIKRIPHQEEEKMTVREVPPENPLEHAKAAHTLPEGHVEDPGHPLSGDDSLHEEPVLIEVDTAGAVSLETESSETTGQSAPSRNAEILQAALIASAPTGTIQMVPPSKDLQQPAAPVTAEEGTPERH